MSQTAIQTSPDPKPGVEAALTPRTEGRTAWQWVKTVLTPLASLRLTVVLFALSLFLVFSGTLAQKEVGMWTAVDTYFRSALVWIPFQLFVRFGQIFFSHFVPETASVGVSAVTAGCAWGSIFPRPRRASRRGTPRRWPCAPMPRRCRSPTAPSM